MLQDMCRTVLKGIEANTRTKKSIHFCWCARLFSIVLDCSTKPRTAAVRYKHRPVTASRPQATRAQNETASFAHKTLLPKAAGMEGVGLFNFELFSHHLLDLCLQRSLL